MRTNLVTLAAVTLAAVLTSAAEIKSTTKLQISVAGADARAVVVTDPRVLAMSHVYVGQFIGQPVEVPNYQSLYTIRFDIQARDGIRADAYAVQYAVDGQGRGFIHLPGRGEPYYRGNISTIIRNRQDGRWHRAAPEWSAALQPYLP